MRVVDSTNKVAKEKVLAGCPEWTLVTADHQTHGKGTQGKLWESQPGKSALMSVVLYPTDKQKMSQFPNIAANCVCQTLQEIVPDKSFSVKHPNDVYVDNKKISGVLVESSSKGDKIEYAIIGINRDKDFQGTEIERFPLQKAN